MKFNSTIFILLIVLIISCYSIDYDVCDSDSKYRIVDFNGLKGFTDIDDGIKCSKEMRLPILLLFTGHACVADNSYEERLFLNRRNRKIIGENFIPVILYVDDKTDLLEEDRKNIRFKGKKRYLSNLGHKNSNYEMQEFNSNTQPLLTILDHNGKPIIHHISYKRRALDYQEFIERGLERYRLIAKEK
ncbi:MAG: thioredoxin-related protein [Polaribacter sp.]|jgi:thioredoxin-related protein